MSENRPSEIVRSTMRQSIIVIIAAIILGLVLWGFRESLGPAAHYLLFLQAVLLGYAMGRIHQRAIEQQRTP